MSGARTEQPTPRRLREARARGEVAVSRELTAAAMLGAGLTALAAGGAGLVAPLAAHLRASLALAISGEPAPLAAATASALLLLRTALPVLASAAAAGLLAGLVQTRFLLAPGLVRLRLDRLDPASGLRRLLAGGRWATALLGLARAALVLAAATWLAARAAPGLLGLPRAPLGGLAVAWERSLAPAAWALAALLLLLGAVDLLVARRRLQSRLRMTREELLRELREEEGEPLLRQERRRVQQALASAPPLARAAVVVVNPSHLAVALAHDGLSDCAPTVVAKAAGPAAARLRVEARRAGVPVIRNVPLARSLFRLAEVGDAIPEELYQAAAEVLVQLHRPSRGVRA